MTVNRPVPRLTPFPQRHAHQTNVLQRLRPPNFGEPRFLSLNHVPHSTAETRGSPSSSPTCPTHGFETAVVSSQSESVEAVDAHHLNIARVARQVETDHDYEIGQHQDAPLEVVALAFAVDVAEQEHTKDDGHHVPLREDEVEGVVQKLFGCNVPAVDGAEKDKGGDLEETDLESIGRTDLH